MLNVLRIIKDVFKERHKTLKLRKPSLDTTGNEDFRLIAENSADVIIRFGSDVSVLYASPASLSMFGRTPAGMVGLGAAELIVPDDISMVQSACILKLAGEDEDVPITCRILRKDGRHVWVEGNCRAIRDPDTGKPGDVVIVLRDITQRKALEDKLSLLAMTDSLTGLDNRRAFDQNLELEWQRTLRQGTEMSLLLLDLDNFKGFNDHYGHQVGDDCLRSVAIAVQGAIRRPGDTVARYGGEELAIILADMDAAGALQVAEQIRIVIEALRLPHFPNVEGGGWVTASIGVATAICRMGGASKLPEALLTTADAALYKAKQNGRNRIASGLILSSNDISQRHAST